MKSCCRRMRGSRRAGSLGSAGASTNKKECTESLHLNSQWLKSEPLLDSNSPVLESEELLHPNVQNSSEGSHSRGLSR